ncbi:MAG: PAS domain-containing protein, partial [Desulfobulbaceae bacterium]|nr:PAS domain-containing protein [Desulfobulbaceae bacterium]
MQAPYDEHLCNLIVTGLPLALLVVDDQFNIVEFNAAAEEVTGWRRNEVLGKPCAEILSSNLCRDRCPLRESVETGTACINREAVIQTKEGGSLAIFFSSVAQVDENGRLVNGIEVFRDGTAIKKLEAQKNNLISLFTHDLKAPVAIAGGFVDRLLQGKAGPLNEKQGQYLKTAHREITRLEQYIHSFLNISKIESGQVELKIEEKNIGGLLKEIVEGFKVQAGKKQIKMSLDLTGLQSLVSVDTLQITRVISNLLDNAIKYSKKETSIQVLVTEDATHMILEVNDHGPGIELADQEHIFDSFYRLPGSSKQAGGSGLGLAAVRAIVEAHGGKAWVKSRPGEGSSFKVSL